MRTFLFPFLLSLVLVAHLTEVKAQFYHAKSYKMNIQGTSSYHDWTSNVNNISFQGEFLIANGTIEKIKNATVLVLTKSIQSEQHSNLMDDRTHNTLKADKYPSITYEFISVKSIEKEQKQTTLIINGTLNLAGTSKTTELQLNVSTNELGEIIISGEKKIKMSDYGIKPPVFMLGLLRVGDQVTISYEVVLEQKK
jgi:polyisoprenoid-binding protein YceI